MTGNSSNRLQLQEQVSVKLAEIFSNVNSWLTFAETKNATLIALNGAGVFGLVCSLLNSDYNGGPWLTLYLWNVVVFLGLGTVISLLSFSPVVSAFKAKKKFPSRNKANLNLLFYGELVQYDSAKDYVVQIYKRYYNTGLNENQVSKIHLDYADEILINSRITARKYTFFKWALFSDLLAIFSPLLFVLPYLCYLGIKTLA